MNVTSPLVGLYAARLVSALQLYTDDNEIGEISILAPSFALPIGTHTVVRTPDIAFVRHERIPPPQAGPWQLVPDLVVQFVASAPTPADELADYLAAGVPLIWRITVAQQTAEVYERSATPQLLAIDGCLDGGEVIPGFYYPLKLLFRERNSA